uniref:Probable dual-specificity RNA methyltransferase RlmN n=1 Tax=Nicotiana tabacum TaxID=4097 RepID=A0A1S4C1K1_TOBAC|nr:PREDICTED: probable dual-specificity RNA methyltransferase RlmN [Nicotiana tabacum]
MAMAVLQYGCSLPLARALRSRTFTVASSSVRVPSLKKASQMDSHVLLGLSDEQLQQIALDFGQKSFRGKQLYHLIYKRKVKEIQEFSQLPLAFRYDLEEAGWRVGRSPIHKAVTAADGTIKLLIKLEDNRLVETVGIPVKDNDGSSRLTACVSSQVGCPLRCSFCATGKGGFSRNLKSHEIVDQVLAIEELFKQRVTNVVFMGMGEPMLNMKEVLEAHRCLNKVLLSRISDLYFVSPLYISLHAPNQNLREKIVPSAKSYPLNAIMKDCRDYFLETRRRVSFEYTLLAGVNDSVEHAIELAELLHEWGRGHHVNLIPFNPIEGSEYKRPSKRSVLAFVSALESRKVTASVRQTRGLDASAACGQLRNEFQKSPLLTGNAIQESHSVVALAS